MISSFFLLLLMSVFTSHPLALCLSLVAASLSVSVLLHGSTSLWMFNALILIFLGGMMILFLYISTLSNNEKLLVPKGSVWLFMVIILAWVFMMLLGFDLASSLLSPGESFHINREQSISDLSTLYTFMSSPHLIYMLTMLLVTLFCTVKLTEGFKGSLTKKTQSN